MKLNFKWCRLRSTFVLDLSLTQLVTNPTYINRVTVHDCLPLTFTISFRDELALADHE